MTENDATILATKLFTRWRPSLVRYVLQASVSHDVAEDLVQDVFVVLYQTLRSGKYLEHPKAWTLCVLKRALNRRLRQDSRQYPLDPSEHLYDPQNNMVNAILVRGFWSMLSKREKEVLALRLEEYKYREIADCLDISMKTVDTLVGRALRKLRALQAS
jgi:RNA polymerase sigma-70 factor (ECF subfamily)